MTVVIISTLTFVLSTMPELTEEIDTILFDNGTTRSVLPAYGVSDLFSCSCLFSYLILLLLLLLLPLLLLLLLLRIHLLNLLFPSIDGIQSERWEGGIVALRTIDTLSMWFFTIGQ